MYATVKIGANKMSNNSELAVSCPAAKDHQEHTNRV